MTISTISAQDAAQLCRDGALLVDIRDRDAFARESIAGARHMPLAEISTGILPAGQVVFHCQSGMRTAHNAALLAAAVPGGAVYLLEGGIDGWRKAGLPTRQDRSQPIEIIRQVHITAGLLILTGALLGWLVTPGFFLLSAMIGAGLLFAGLSGWCGMAHLLRLMPWNRGTFG